MVVPPPPPSPLLPPSYGEELLNISLSLSLFLKTKIEFLSLCPSLSLLFSPKVSQKVSSLLSQKKKEEDKKKRKRGTHTKKERDHGERERGLPLFLDKGGPLKKSPIPPPFFFCFLTPPKKNERKEEDKKKSASFFSFVFRVFFFFRKRERERRNALTHRRTHHNTYDGIIPFAFALPKFTSLSDISFLLLSEHTIKYDASSSS